MIGDLSRVQKIYLVTGRTDMRKSFDGLMAVIRDNFQMDPFSNAVFLFCGRKKNTMKALYFDRDGFVLLQKRLDNGKFQWPRKAKATREDQYGNLPIHKEVIPLPEEDKYCPYCNSKMEYVTETFVREELRITPAKVERIHYYQEKWQCPECKKDGDGTFAESKTPTALIPHSPASPSIVSYVAMEKIGLAMPYYRQEFLMNQLGFTLPRETMANWIIYVAGNYFYPIYERLHEELLKRDLVHADETTCQVLREKGRTAEQTSYMWLYTTGSDAPTPIVLYDYQPSRKGSCAQNFLEGFRGLVQCDGYQGYNKLGKAVNYAQNHHDTLMNYLLDGRCEISNNRAERKAKSYAIGRKAFLFHTSETGDGASAVMYSIVETAKANNLNIFQYLYTVLLYMPDYTNSSAGIEQLMPWSEFIKEQCSGLIDVESNVPEKRIPLPHR